MTPLDLRSFNLFGGLVCTTMGLVLLAVRLHFRSPVRGLGHWGVAPLMAVASAVLFGLEGQVPAGLVVVGGNGLLLGCNIAMLAGTSRFLHRPWRWWPWLTGTACCLLVLLCFSSLWPDYRVRMMTFAGTMAWVCAAHARLLWGHGRGLSARLMGAAMVWQTAVLGVRAVATWWIDRPDTQRFEPVSVIHTVYVGTFGFSVMLLLVGGLLMFSEYLRQHFEHLATHDDLTGLLNRRALTALIDRAHDLWQTQRQPYALLLMDVDHFKRINDALGHQAGDRALAGVAATLQQGLRASDTLGRFGGEEFMALLPGADAEAALRQAEQLGQRLAQRAADAHSPACTISIGVAVVGVADAQTRSVLARADAALYQAKAAGRNRVVMA